jgi:hypothetical protein
MQQAVKDIEDAYPTPPLFKPKASPTGTTCWTRSASSLAEIITPDRSNFSRENCYQGHRTDGMMSRIAYAWRFLFSWLYYYKYHTQVVPTYASSYQARPLHRN